MRVGLAALVVMASIIAGTPASAASLAALPAEVRVNIGGLGFSYAVLSSTGTLAAIAPDGTLLYRGDGKVVARTNVRSLRASGVELPPPRAAGSMSPDERADRAALRRDARLAVADSGPLAVMTVRFQISLLQAGGDEQGAIALQSDKIQNVKLRTNDGLLLLNGHPYRGTFELAADDEGDLTVVNVVSTHDYLASVVGSEVPSSWENEMLAAQAIAARTYLYTHLGRHRSYDLEGDTRDQQYDGTIKEDPRTLRAVERTAGVIATYRNTPIEALYSANAGGITEDSENVFPNALPYLRSVASPSDVVAKDSSWGASSWQWTRELSATQLRDFLQKRGVTVGTPTGIQLTSVSPTGRVITAKILGTAGSYDVGKDRSRYYFGLLSSLFTVAVTPTGANERVAATSDARIAALEALGAHVVQTSFEMLLDPNGNELGLRPTGFVYELPARFAFTGKGFGHGVGMSQWGAQGLALSGATYTEILAHYYSGIALTPVGGG